MSLIGHLFRSSSKVSRTGNGSRSARRNRAQFSLESLEARDLKSNLPGVSAQMGYIAIQSTQSSGNQVSVSIDPQHNNDVKVTVNGQSDWFDGSQSWSINYAGSQGGHDTFVNDTSFGGTYMSYGDGNNFKGSSGFDVVYSYGDNNNYDMRGGGSFIMAYNGPNNNITAHSDDYIYSTSYAAGLFG